VDSGEKLRRRVALILDEPPNIRHRRHLIYWSSDMFVLPQDLAGRISDQKSSAFRLPLEAARKKAREIIDQPSQRGITLVIEKWRQLPDGQIEFSITHLPAAD
jgi:hypothetical protein